MQSYPLTRTLIDAMPVTTPGVDAAAGLSKPSPAGANESGDAPAPARKRTFGEGNAYPPYRSKVDDLLRDEHRPDYETLILNKTSLRALNAWLNARGYDIGRESVRRHRADFLRECLEVERASRTALRFARLARRSGVTLSDSTIGGLHQVLMEFFTRQQTTQALTARDVDLLASAVDRFVGTSGKVERVRKELSAAGAAKAEVDGTAVVNRVRRILGMPPIDAPLADEDEDEDEDEEEGEEDGDEQTAGG